MKETSDKRSSTPLKPATHLSFALAWRGTKDHTNFAYAQSATITWSEQLATWVLSSFLNGNKARSATINKGDIIWQAASEHLYFKLVNSGDTVKAVRDTDPAGTWSIWDGDRLVLVQTPDPAILRPTKRS